MEYATERQVLHREWDTVTLEASDFFRLYEASFSSDEDDEELDTYSYSPIFKFENGNMHGDEIWGLRKDGKVWTRSVASGVVDWAESAGQYVSHYHFRETKLGGLVSVEFRLDDDLRAALDKL